MTESMVPGIYHPEELSEKVMIADGEAFEVTRLMAQKEGLFVGTSAGAAVAVALQKARQMERGTIVVILPDRGDRYLSTMQFRSVCAKCPPVTNSPHGPCAGQEPDGIGLSLRRIGGYHGRHQY